MVRLGAACQGETCDGDVVFDGDGFAGEEPEAA